MKYWLIVFWVFVAVLLVCVFDSFSNKFINIYGGGMPSFYMWVVVILEKVFSVLAVLVCSYFIYKKN